MNHFQRKLDEAFSSLLKPRSVSGRPMILFIGRTLKQFNLNGFYDEMDILHEVYERARKFIETGGCLEKPLPWIRGAAYNVIRELSRGQQRLAPLLDESVLISPPQENDTEEFQETFEIVKSAFQQLSLEEKELLSYKLVEGLSWSQICQRRAEQGKRDLNEAALRKRKERALKRLRDCYQWELQSTAKVR